MAKLLRVVQVWNGTVIREKTLSRRQSVTLGAKRSATFNVPTESEGYTLLKASGSGYTLSPEAGMTVEVKKDGKFSAASGSIEIAEGVEAVVHIGDVDLFVQWTVPQALILGAGSGVESEYISSQIASMALHAGLMLMLLALVPIPNSLRNQELQEHIVNILVDGPSNAIEDLEEEDAPDDETTSAAAAGEEGKFGEEDSAFEDSILPDHDGPLREELPSTELGSAMSQAISMSGAMANVFGASSNFTGQAGIDFATAGTGDMFQVGRGVGGMGMAGFGRGGGGTGPGRVHGVGSIDTGSGRGQGASLGNRGERERRPRATMGRPTANGFCSREMIERVVRRHQRGIRFCYERELQADPELAGRVTAQWTIGLDGSVVSASITENSMSNRDVESCMVAEIRRMRFDQPDGGQCIISFPFTFRSE
jgi:hypothetical protein